VVLFAYCVFCCVYIWHWLTHSTTTTPLNNPAVASFARKTGDYYSLSVPDLKVLALAFQLEKQVHGMVNIRENPRDSNNAAPAGPQRASLMDQMNASAPKRLVDQKKINTFNVDDLLFLSVDEYSAKHGYQPEQVLRNQQEEEKKAALELQKKNAEKKAIENANKNGAASSGKKVSQSPFSFGSDGGWVTPDNLQDYLLKNQKTDDDSTLSDSSVGCITTDFAMQNVMLQMGLRLISVNGLAISSVKQWVLRCHACFKVVKDMSKEFCPGCGNHTLVKMSATVTANGQTRFHGGLKKVFNKRGTKYSIPKAKGGRELKDAIFREDALPVKGRKKKESFADYDPFKDAIEFGYTSVGGPRAYQKTVGYNQRNPNIPKRRSGKKKRK